MEQIEEDELYQEEKLRIKFPEFFEKFDKIISESRKYNLIDRFFHFAIEEDELHKYIPSLNPNGYDVTNLSIAASAIGVARGSLLHTIRQCYGLRNIDFHIDSNRIIFLNNPNLLGISPFLFNQEDWQKIMLNEIEKFKHDIKQFKPTFWMIQNCLDETFYRLGGVSFYDLKYEFLDDYSFLWDENIKTSTDIFASISNDFLDSIEKLEIAKNVEKEQQDFLKSEIKNKSLSNKIAINCTFELADKIFEKYFELTIPSDRSKSVSDDFRYYLKIIMNEDQFEKENIKVQILPTEIKGFIKMFRYLKKKNIITYENSNLFTFIEMITLLKKTSTWEKYHKPKNNEIESKLSREINSIIDKVRS